MSSRRKVPGRSRNSISSPPIVNNGRGGSLFWVSGVITSMVKMQVAISFAPYLILELRTQTMREKDCNTNSPWTRQDQIQIKRLRKERSRNDRESALHCLNRHGYSGVVRGVRNLRDAAT